MCPEVVRGDSPAHIGEIGGAQAEGAQFHSRGGAGPSSAEVPAWPDKKYFCRVTGNGCRRIVARFGERMEGDLPGAVCQIRRWRGRGRSEHCEDRAQGYPGAEDRRLGGHRPLFSKCCARACSEIEIPGTRFAERGRCVVVDFLTKGSLLAGVGLFGLRAQALARVDSAVCDLQRRRVARWSGFLPVPPLARVNARPDRFHSDVGRSAALFARRVRASKRSVWVRSWSCTIMVMAARVGRSPGARVRRW